MAGELAPKPGVEEMSDDEIKQGLEAAEEMKQKRDAGSDTETTAAPEAKVETKATDNETVTQFAPGEPLHFGMSYEDRREEMKRRYEEQD